MLGISLVPKLNMNLNSIILKFLGPEEYYNSIQYLNRSMYAIKNSEEIMNNIFIYYQPLIFDFDYGTKTLKYFKLNECMWDWKEIEIPADFPENNYSFVHTPENMIFCFAQKPNNAIYTYNPMRNKMQKICSMKYARKGFGTIRILKNIYIIGGEMLTECEKFDYIGRKIIPMASCLNKNCISFTLCGIENKYIYKFITWLKVPDNNLIEKYSISENIWTNVLISNIGNYAIQPSFGCIAINDNKIIIFGRMINKTKAFLYTVKESEFKNIDLPSSILYPDSYYPYKECIKDELSGSFFTEGATRVLKYSETTGFSQFGL